MLCAPRLSPVWQPAASDALKEHCLQATASLAGLPECELSFPELLGKFLSAKLPGTQRDALAALELVREKQGKAVDARLAACTPLVDGLRGAAGSSDAGVAAGAATIMTAFGL